MNSKTAYNHLTRLKLELESIFSSAQCYCSTHDAILARVKLVYDKVPAKCPAWVKSSLFELSRYRFEHIQRNLVLWLFKTSNGFVSWEHLSEAERAEYNQPDKRGNFVWLRNVTHCGTVGDKNDYRSGRTIARSFEVTDRIFS